MKPGFHPQITAREYFQEPCPTPALTNSSIKLLLTATPAEMAYAHPGINPGNPVSDSSAAKRFGDVAHQLALGKGRGFAVGDFPDWRTKVSQEFKAAAEEAGLTPIKRADYELAEASADRMQDAIARALWEVAYPARDAIEPEPPDYQTELVITWQEQTKHGPIWCRAMLDVWCDSASVCLDPKFTKRLAPGIFESHATGLGWDMQAAWYIRGLTALLPERAGRIRFINPLVNPTPPHVSRAVEADEATRYSCQMEIERAIEIFAACQYAGEWPGYLGAIQPWTAKSYTMAERAARAADDE